MPAANAPADLETAVARVRRLQAILRELTEIGMQMARALRGEPPGLDVVTRYTRIAKAIRRLVALEAKLGQALEAVAAGRWAEEQAVRALRLHTLHTEEDEVVEAVEEVLDEVADAETVRRIRERLCDWQDQRAVETDFAMAPATEIIGRASRDLGVIPDPTLMADPALRQTFAQTVDDYARALAARPEPGGGRFTAPSPSAPARGGGGPRSGGGGRGPPGDGRERLSHSVGESLR